MTSFTDGQRRSQWMGLPRLEVLRRPVECSPAESEGSQPKALLHPFLK